MNIICISVDVNDASSVQYFHLPLVDSYNLLSWRYPVQLSYNVMWFFFFFFNTRKPKEAHCCPEENSRHCVCRRTVPVQLSQLGSTDPQVGSEVFMIWLGFCNVSECPSAAPVFVRRHMPGHTSREILIILSSLTTCDPANIYELIKVKSLSYWGLFRLYWLNCEAKMYLAFYFILMLMQFSKLCTFSVRPWTLWRCGCLWSASQQRCGCVQCWPGRRAACTMLSWMRVTSKSCWCCTSNLLLPVPHLNAL